MCPEAAFFAPPDLRTDPALTPLVDILQTNFSQRALQEIDPLFKEARSVQRKDQHITVARDKTTVIPLGGEFLNGTIRATSLELGNVSFDLDEKRQTASNVKGISLNLDLFGSQHSLAVRKLRLGQDETGAKVLRVDLENPLPKPAERIIGMAPTISVDIPITSNGLGMPKLSKVFSDAASSNGTSIAGLLASDALKEGSKVAFFVESNPEWINTIIQPVLHEIYKALAPPRDNSVRPVQGPGTAASSDATATPSDQPRLPGTVADLPGKPGDHVYKFTIAGAERTYHVHVPPSYNGKTPMPVVIILHGHAQDGPEIARHTRLSELADKKGFIAVYPDARKWAGREEWRAWDSGNGLLPLGARADDESFLRKIIEKTEKDLVVDSKRIFMAGLSNGGMMTFKAASELSDKLAAIAVISSAMSGSESPPKSPLSVLNIHGTADSLIPYEGLKNVPATLTAVGLPKFQPTKYATSYWVEQNKISNPPIVLQNADVTQRRFIDDKTGTEVNEYTIDGGDHVPDKIIELTETVWQFFDSHPKSPGSTSGTLQPPGEEPFNITERIKAHARQRGVSGIEIDIGRMLNEVPQLGDGSFSPSHSIQKFETRSGIQLEDGVSEFLKQATEISKRQNRVAIDLKTPWKVDVNETAGPFTLTSINVDNPSFDLNSENGCPAMTHIKGISFDLKALGTNFNVAVTDAAQKIDKAGSPFYKMETKNPMHGWARVLMIASSQVPIELKFDSSARPYILNERSLKDAALGVNPVSRGYIDFGTHVHDLFSSPSWKNGLHVAKDLALFGGSAWGGYRLAALRYGTKARVGGAIGLGLLLAPPVIHGIERLIR